MDARLSEELDLDPLLAQDFDQLLDPPFRLAQPVLQRAELAVQPVEAFFDFAFVHRKPSLIAGEMLVAARDSFKPRSRCAAGAS